MSFCLRSTYIRGWCDTVPSIFWITSTQKITLMFTSPPYNSHTKIIETVVASFHPSLYIQPNFLLSYHSDVYKLIKSKYFLASRNVVTNARNEPIHLWNHVVVQTKHHINQYVADEQVIGEGNQAADPSHSCASLMNRHVHGDRSSLGDGTLLV
jgi:hypothetical protein